MILGLDIWVYNFQEVLGSIPSRALFLFFFPKFMVMFHKNHNQANSRFTDLGGCLQMFGARGAYHFGKYPSRHYSNINLNIWAIIAVL